MVVLFFISCCLVIMEVDVRMHCCKDYLMYTAEARAVYTQYSYSNNEWERALQPQRSSVA